MKTIIIPDFRDALAAVPEWVHLVVNVKDYTAPKAASLEAAGVLYVGRGMNRLGLRQHPLHNPYKLESYGDDRQACLLNYYEHLKRLPRLETELAALRGLTLACWCAPELCHAHLLVVLANRSPEAS